MMIELEGITKSFGFAGTERNRSDNRQRRDCEHCRTQGAGKTTLLQIIGTLDRPDSGRVVLNNRGEPSE